MKGGTLIVEGSVGYLAGFMTHAGDLIVCGDAGEALGDSLWAGNIWVAGKIAGLGADAMVVGDHGRGVRRGSTGCCAAGGHRRDVRVQARDRRAEALVLQRARPGGLAEDMSENHGYTDGRSHIWTTETIRDIHAKAELGRYQIRGFSTFRKFPSWDDLVFLPAVMTRLPLEGYREHCETKTVIGGGKPDLVARPLELDIPVYLTSMSFGALGANAKMALGKGFSAAGSASSTGEGGMLDEERAASTKLIYQMTPSRYGLDLEHLRLADGIEVALGQGAKPGTGGLLLGMKVSEKVANMRSLPLGVDQRSCVRHPDFLGADDLQVKIEELREATDYQVPIFLKLAACRVEFDVKIAVKTGCDAILLDGTEGATAAAPEYQLDNCGIPLIASIRTARARDRGARRERQGAARRLGRHPQRRRHRQVPRARRRRRRDRHLGADRAGLQLGPVRGGLRARSAPRRARATTATRAAARSASRRRIPQLEARLDPEAGARARRQLPARDDDGADRRREVGRQEERAQPGAGGPPRHVARGVGVRRRAAGRRRVDGRPAAVRRLA